MISSSNIDALETAVKAEFYDLEHARKMAAVCLESGGSIGPRDSFIPAPSPELNQALGEVIRAHSNDDSKRWAQRVVELARKEL